VTGESAGLDIAFAFPAASVGIALAGTFKRGVALRCG
jgi:ABC-type sulfate transport system permease component